MNDKIVLGRVGEEIAANYLSKNNYLIIEKNYRTYYGEIDIIAIQGDSLVFVEVKTRRSLTYGNPEDAITPRKRSHMLSAAQSYLQNHMDVCLDWRFDVIAIEMLQNMIEPKIVHFENILID